MNSYKTESEVYVFHDETSKIGEQKTKGHILLFVPTKLKISFDQKILFKNSSYSVNSMMELYDKIKELRENYNDKHKFHFTDISGKKWSKNNEMERKLVLIGLDALRRKNMKLFPEPLNCKFAVIFFPPPTTSNLVYYRGDRNERKLRFYETILRMLLKGAVHYLYDKNNKVKILKIITDGQPYHRKLSGNRILWKLIEESLSGNLQDYVNIPIDAEIVALESDHKKYEVDSEKYIYANMLQLTDMLLGSVIQSCIKGIKWQKLYSMMGDKVKDKKSIVAYPVKEMLDKRKRGKNWEYSGHYKSFAISRIYIREDKWRFENVTTKDIEIDLISKQMNLFDFEVKS